jgi:hypothetical protein
LKARGHRTVDAEKHLEWMKERLRLRNRPEGRNRTRSELAAHCRADETSTGHDSRKGEGAGPTGAAF